MKNTRPFWKLILLACVGLVMALAPPVMAVAGAARALYVATKLWTVKIVSAGFALAHRREPDRTPAAVILVRAKSFYSSLVQRSRPRMTDGWRMVPSI